MIIYGLGKFKKCLAEMAMVKDCKLRPLLIYGVARKMALASTVTLQPLLAGLASLPLPLPPS